MRADAPHQRADGSGVVRAVNQCALVPDQLHATGHVGFRKPVVQLHFRELETRAFEDVDRRQRQRAVDRLMLAMQGDGQVHELAGVGDQAHPRVRAQVMRSAEAATELDVCDDLS